MARRLRQSTNQPHDRKAEMRLPEQSKPVVRITAPVKTAVGLGDVVKAVTSKMGIEACGGCQKRAAALNRLVGFAPRGER
jgi:hypothetical protein